MRDLTPREIKYMSLYKPRTHLSISALCEFSRCPRKFFFSNLGVREPHHTAHPALTFGSALHAAIPLAQKVSLEAAVKRFTEVWDNSVADEKRNTINGIAMLQDWARHRTGPDRPYTILDPPAECPEFEESRSEYEIPYVIMLECGIPLIGWIDCAVRLTQGNKLCAGEFKTASTVSDFLTAGFDLHPQTTGYAMVLQLFFPDEKVYGTYVDFLGVSKKPDKRITWGKPVYVNPNLYEDFLKWAEFKYYELRSMEERLADSIKTGKGSNPFIKDFTGCHPYASFGCGGFTCPYMEICTTSDWSEVMGGYKLEPRKEVKIIKQGSKDV